jgi:dihydrofolate synthase/folylpolyglutamate synthase
MARFKTLQTWLDWQEQFHPRPIRLGLERVSQVFKRLYPHYAKPFTIIVGGTNGKGSCVAFLEAIYKAQGYKVGTYTSPHIIRYHERIKINGSPVDDEQICHAFTRIEAVRKNVSLSYFEFGTLAALDIFSRQKVDIQLLEVGLGGRLDAVNIIDADLSLITSLSIDHVDLLGGTRNAIGTEKAGIFRTNIPAVIGDLNPPLSIFQVAKKIKTPLLCLNEAFFYQKKSHYWLWRSEQKTYSNLPYPALTGKHQFNNAATVLMAITQLQPLLPVQRLSIERGLKQVNLQGRFQLINTSPPLLLDVGHNPQAVQMLADYLSSRFKTQKIYAVFSIMADKDISGILDVMKTQVDHWFISPLKTPRVMKNSVLQKNFAQKNMANVCFGFQTFKDTFHAAKETAQKDDLILIFGSFFLVSEYLTAFEHNTESHP